MGVNHDLPTALAAHTATILLLAAMTIGCNRGDGPNTDPDSGSTTRTDARHDEDPDAAPSGEDADSDTTIVRVATFNASLFRQNEGELRSDLSGGDDAQARQLASLLQVVRPDVVLLNEVDWDADGESARVLYEEYLAVPQGDAEPLQYGHRFVPTTNTGLPSGVDLDGDGRAVTTSGTEAYGNDAFGFGTFPGHYGMVVYSRHPILDDRIRTFQTFLWKDMPDNLLPTQWYSTEAVDVLRLSSKNHVDVPIDVEGRVIHLLASHPTPPGFDGEEDRNGRRNHDEIRLWLDYVTGDDAAAYLVDDAGAAGGLDADAAFVILGDLNSDPRDGDSRRQALQDLLAHPRVHDPRPASEGGDRAADSDGGANASHDGDPKLDTADFSDGRVGNLRVDYALPSSNLTVVSAGVFWPPPDGEHADLLTVSDHRLVWVDIAIER